ncbi:MAG: hypothetical protein FJ147_04180 [Deltaproteobacteria bacterium]|nr:hypothetical protein [Deltaproteobacteria bacterium]
MSDDERTALRQHVGKLERRSPGVEGQYHIAPWLGHDHAYRVSIRPPEDEEVWLALSEGMAQVATDLVAQTSCLFALTTIE